MDKLQILNDILDDLIDVAVETPRKGFPLNIDYIEKRIKDAKIVENVLCW